MTRKFTVCESDEQFFNDFFGGISSDEIADCQTDGIYESELRTLHAEWDVFESTGEEFGEWIENHFSEKEA